MELSSNSPISETTFFILLSISTGPMHGYAIMKDVRTLSNGRILLSTGTLYGALKRLLDLGWIIRANGGGPTESQRERKAYKLTNLGKRILDEEVVRLSNLVEIAEQRRAEELT